MAVITGAFAAVGAACALVALEQALGTVHARRIRRRIDPASRSVAVLSSVAMPGSVRRAFARADLASEAERLWACWCAAVLFAVLTSTVVGGGPVLVLAAVVAPAVGLVAGRDRAHRRRIRQLPDALEAVAAGLRGGSSLPSAIADAATIGSPLGPELGALAAETAAGRALAGVVAGWADRAPDRQSRLAAAALAVAAEVGGPGARALDGAAASLRDRRASDDEAAALSTQGRLSAVVLTAAPVVFAFLLATLDPASAHFLLGTPPGWICIVSGLGLDALGAWWMSRLVRGAR